MRRPFHGWRVVAACFVIAAFAWGLGLFGASVYLQAVTAAHGWTIGEVAVAITVFFLVSASIQRLVGVGIDRLGPRPVMSIGVLALGLGVALIGRVTTLWQLYLCFAVVGIGWATLSTTGISATVAPWFERHQGRSMTLAIMGASIGGIVAVPLLIEVLGRLGLGPGLLAVGAVSIAVLLPLVAHVLRWRGPADIGQRRDGDAPRDGTAATPATAQEPVAASGRPRVLLATVAAGFALGLLVQIGFITHHVALAAPLLGLVGAGYLVSATAAVALLGRLILAAIVDRIDPRRLAVAIMLAQSLALLALSLWPSVPVLVAASLVYGYGIGHVTTLGPIVVRREFGPARFGATYGSAATVIQLTSAFGPALFGALRDAFGGYGPGLALAAAGTLAGAIVLTIGGSLGRRRAR